MPTPIARVRRALYPSLVASLAVGSIVAAQTAPPPAQPPASILAIVRGLRSDNGFVRVGLFNSPAHWAQAGGNFMACRSAIHNRQASCVLQPVQAGAVYAIAFDHDENNNGHFDTNWIGIPVEGYGFSRDAHPRLSAPAYSRCQFVHPGGQFSITMTAQY